MIRLAEERTRAAWQRTAATMALMANCHRDPKKTRAFKPTDFDPYVKRSAPLKMNVSVLRDVFVRGRMPEISEEP